MEAMAAALLPCFTFPRRKRIARRPPAAPAGGGSATSTSVISADMDDAGTHELTVSGYSGTKGLGVGKFISSAEFSVGGHSWRIKYYPDGQDQKSKDWISVYLQLADVPAAANKGEACRAQFQFSLLDDAGKPWVARTSAMPRTFSKDAWGFSDFVTRESLESSPHLLKDDSFRISCRVTVVKIRAETTPPLRFVAAPSGDLARDLAGLLDSKVGGDAKFRVGRETFTAHRSVLAARSPVFKAELLGQMKEKTAAQILIDDMEAEAFKALLYFVYTDSLPEIDEGEEGVMAQHLLVAADRYDLQRLRLVSEETLCRFVETSSAATTLVLAEQHGCHRLKERCFRFLKSPGNMKAVMATDGYKHLMTSCPLLSTRYSRRLLPDTQFEVTEVLTFF